MLKPPGLGAMRRSIAELCLPWTIMASGQKMARQGWLLHEKVRHFQLS